jgi:hypothetical protein
MRLRQALPVLVGMLIVNVGCRGLATTAPAAPASDTPTSISSPKPPTLTAPPASPSVTPRPATVPTSSQPTPKPLIIFTPTLSADAAQELLISRLRDNGDCQLPCWWGITPGQTDLPRAFSILRLFSSIALHETDESDDSDDGYFMWRLPQGDFLVDVTVGYDRRGTDEVQELNVSVVMRSYDPQQLGYFVLEDPQLYFRYVPSLALSNVLRTYGPPQSVSLFGDRGMDRVTLSLLYPSLGIHVEYVAGQRLQGDNFVMCPDKAYPSLNLWNTTHAATDRRVMLLITEWEAAWHKPLPEAASLSVDDFVRLFSDGQNTTCLKTPIHLWPEP